MKPNRPNSAAGFTIIEIIAFIFVIIIAVSIYNWLGKSDNAKKSDVKNDVMQSNIEPRAAKPVVGKDLQLIVDRGTSATAESVIKDIENKQQKNYEDFIDLGTCYVWSGNFQKASDAYENAARQADSPQKLGGALYTKAVAMSYININQSLIIIDFASRVLPYSMEIARLRLSLHQKTSNMLGLAVAQDHLSKLDPSFIGHEVMTGIEVVVIGAVATIAIAAVTATAMVKMTPPNDRKEVVKHVMTEFRKIVEAVKDAIPRIPITNAI